MTKPSIDLPRLLAEEPFVRALAHSLIADEADDVVQQAYLQALEHQGDAVTQPRGWLSRVVRNLVADQRRRRIRREARQRAAAVPERVPSSSELLEGEERRRALVTAVDRLPTDQRTVVLLRYYDGMAPRRIAVELQLPVSTVWNRLHAALQTLRRTLDAEHDGNRRAWLLPLVPFATQPRALPWREVIGGSGKTAFWLGVMTMTAKTKLVAALAALFTIAGAMALWPSSGSPSGEPRITTEARAPVAAKGDLQQSLSPNAQRELVGTNEASPPTTGSLIVHVQYRDEPKAAAGLTIALIKEGGEFRVGVPRVVTDATGTARFDAVPAGKFAFRVKRECNGTSIEVRAGETSECTVRLALGIRVTGIVVDAAGAPVRGAIVEGTEAGAGGTDAETVATTTEDGTFALRAWHSFSLLGARAHGYAASKLHYVQGMPGASEHLKITLSQPGGNVEGIVTGVRGTPVSGAVVRVGSGRTDCIFSTDQGAEPMPAQVTTDAQGRFLAIGVPPGAQPIQVRATGLAPWSGSCEVTAGLTVPVRVTMGAPVTCIGTVRNEQQQPVPDVAVALGQAGDFLQAMTRTAADGSFTLRDLPVGDFELTAKTREAGSAKVLVHGEAGATVRCEVVISNEIALRGRVTDESGAPIGLALLDCTASGNGPAWSRREQTGMDGHFLIPACPAGRRLEIVLTARDYVGLRRSGVDPGAGEVEWKMARDTAPRARILGRVIGASGERLDPVEVIALRGQPQDSIRSEASATDGSFRIEAQAGTWELRVQCKDHASVFAGTRTLQAGETWDLGALELVPGNRLFVHTSSSEQLRLRVCDAHEQFRSGVYAPQPPLQSALLAPGDYLLLMEGEGIAADVLPFAIVQGKDTELTVTTKPGIAQRIEFLPNSGGELPRSIAFQVRRDGKLVLRSYASKNQAGQLPADLYLAPGTYTLTTLDREPPTTATFPVTATAAPPLRVELR